MVIVKGGLAQSFLISSNIIIGRIWVSVWSPISTFENEISNNIILIENLFSEAINVNYYSDAALLIVNNVIHKGGGIFLQSGGEDTRILNNIIGECNTGIDSWSGYLEILNNDLWGNGINYVGIPDQTGINGNIAADPMFVDAAGGDYHLQAGSPCIDAGTNEGAPNMDFDGNPRPIDGDGDNIAVVDMGAFEFMPTEVLEATVDIHPHALNLKSKGRWITAYIHLPEGYNPENIDGTTILLNETIQPVLDPKYDFVTNLSEYLVDHDEDGTLERMVKFDRAEVMALLRIGEATLTITGEVNGIPFEGSDTIRVIGK